MERGSTRSLAILNEFGDTTLVWDEEDDDKMLPIIQKKIDEGVSFFIVEPRFFGLVAPKKTAIDDVDQIKDRRALAIADTDFLELFAAGKVGLASRDTTKTTKTIRKAKNAKDVSENHTVGVKQRKGG